MISDKWEYKVISFTRNDISEWKDVGLHSKARINSVGNNFQTELNKQGTEGW